MGYYIYNRNVREINKRGIKRTNSGTENRREIDEKKRIFYFCSLYEIIQNEYSIYLL